MGEGKRMRTREAARYIAVSARSLASRGWRLRLGVPAYRVGRVLVFDSAALDGWLASHRERREYESKSEGGER